MDVVIREATEADIPGLARLHVRAWNATYPHAHAPPTFELRERQWRAGFASAGERAWFCLVAEADGAMAGFAQGNAYVSADQPHYAGQLNKIYLLREFQRLGIGRRLMEQVARRFLEQGITSMLLFAEADNVPACRFYQALGGESLRDAAGRPSPGNYGWRDLRRLASICPVD